ncbi:hypothetical protein [uncultured Rhodoblastus sp.]|uniref:hypothetical protein n=1 Tax=uncultured Rhodoblastus sp. TaxID=543037 RepID=UPI0025D453E3|nr:hypothetical protein [uncultured Rhodoblastus sp.]
MLVHGQAGVSSDHLGALGVLAKDDVAGGPSQERNARKCDVRELKFAGFEGKFMIDVEIRESLCLGPHAGADRFPE